MTARQLTLVTWLVVFLAWYAAWLVAGWRGLAAMVVGAVVVELGFVAAVRWTDRRR